MCGEREIYWSIRTACYNTHREGVYIQYNSVQQHTIQFILSSFMGPPIPPKVTRPLQNDGKIIVKNNQNSSPTTLRPTLRPLVVLVKVT
jgi:hypothetical protein